MDLATIADSLFVDDDPVVEMPAHDGREASAVRRPEASTGEEVVQLVQDCAESIILLLCDVPMPGATNSSALVRHAVERWRGIEIAKASGRVTPAGGGLPADAPFSSRPFDHASVIDHPARRLLDETKPEHQRASAIAEPGIRSTATTRATHPSPPGDRP